MTPEGAAPNREQLETAIAAQEGLRATLGDAVVDATIGALRAQLSQLGDEVEQQRKLVTVLFMDIAGSTDLMQGRDPEETMAIMDSALSRLAVPIGKHGGRVTRFMGDGFMAIFGFPTARENDPEMALRAGLAVLDQANDLAAELAAGEEIFGFAVRVGVNTGLVVTGGRTEAEDTVMGDAVNLAARLESAAAPGTLLVSRNTYQHVRGLFEVEEGGTIAAKGFPEPVAVYRVIARADGTEQAERGIEGLDIPMIGRRTELAELVNAYELISAGGVLHSVTVIGEAGLGKSRLIREARTQFDTTDHIRLEARASLETQNSPYGLLRNLLERRFGIRNEDEVVRVRTKLVAGIEADLSGDEEAERKAHFIGQTIGYDFSDSPFVRPALDSPQQLRSRAVMYIEDVVRALAGRLPVVVLIEDLQWADASSLDVLDELLTKLAELPVLVVATARPSLRSLRPGWGRRTHHRWIRLEPLTGDESAQLAAAALRKVVGPPEDLRGRLIQHAEGNPYYLEETIRMLVDDGVIVLGDEAWVVDEARLTDMKIPATLSGVIQARLDGLPRAERTALQQASVVGRVFWDATIDYLARDDPVLDDVAATLARLSRREMVHGRTESEFSDASEYLFHHEILRAVAYEGVLRRIRRGYHSSVADWLIANSGDRAAELAPLIAGHLESAGRDGEAMEHYAAAADAALAGYAVDTADEFYERALGLVAPNDRERRFELLLGRSKTLAMRGRRDEQALALDELQMLAGEDPAAMATVAFERAWLHWYNGEYSDAVATARSAVKAAIAQADPVRESWARYALSMALLANEEFEQAEIEARQALQLAQHAGDAHAAARAENAQGLIALAIRELTAARTHLVASADMSRELGDLERELTSVNNVGIVEALVGNYPAARAYFDRCRQIAAEVGDRFAEASGLVNLAWVASSEQQWSTARDLAERAIAQKREFGHTDAVAESLMWLGHALFGLGEVEAAREAYGEALQIREELSQEGLAMGAHAGLARMALAAGEMGAALQHAQVICSYLDGGGTLAGAWEPLRIHLSCAQVLRAAGDPAGDRVLARARKVLLADADRIADPADRQTFLENVPWHREILELTNGEAVQ